MAWPQPQPHEGSVDTPAAQEPGEGGGLLEVVEMLSSLVALGSLLGWSE